MVRNTTWQPNTTQQAVYGYAILWGAIVFAAGILLTWWELPEALKQADISQWKIATWVWLNAHEIGIAGSQVGGIQMSFQTVEFIQGTPKLHLLRVLPVVFVSTTALLVTATMGKVRDEYILQNCVAAGIGYSIVGLSAIVASDARPGVGMIVGVMAILAVSAYVGSLLASALPIPIFAITSLGALLGIGLLTVGGIAAVAAVMIPLGKKVIVGMVLAAVGLWIASNLGS